MARRKEKGEERRKGEEGEGKGRRVEQKEEEGRIIRGEREERKEEMGRKRLKKSKEKWGDGRGRKLTSLVTMGSILVVEPRVAPSARCPTMLLKLNLPSVS